MEGESEKETFFFFRFGMHLLAEILYFLRYGRNSIWAGIFFGAKQPYFYTGMYGMKQTSLAFSRILPSTKLNVN